MAFPYCELEDFVCVDVNDLGDARGLKFDFFFYSLGDFDKMWKKFLIQDI